MRRIVVLLLSLGAILVSSIRSESASEKPKPGGTLTVGVRSDLLLSNPFVNVRSTQGRILDLMFEPLLGLDQKGKIQPNLAESWEVSKDVRVYTFRLRKGIKYHNSHEMTAEDVKFSMDYTMNPKNGAQGFVDLSSVEKVEVTDKYTLRVLLKKFAPGFLSFLTELGTFPVVPKGSLQEGIDKITTFPPGTGPFRFVEWKPQQHVVLERYNDYWGHKGLVERIVLRPIRDDTVRFTTLRTGEVDMIERAPLEWVKQITEGKLKGIQFAAAQHAEFRGLEFNVASPPFSNKKLRQAVAHAVDKKQLLQAAFMGFGEPSDQRYPQGHEWYAEGVPGPSYDLEKARALLKEAGYRGETVELLVHSSLTDQAKGTALQAQLKKIGMDVKLVLVETGEYRARPRRGDFQFRFDGGSLAPDPSMSYGELKCEPDLKKRASNTPGYCDKEMDSLLENAEKEVHPEKRRALFKQIAAKFLDDIPELYLGYVPQFFALRDYVKGFTTDSDANFRWWGGGLNHTWLDK